MPAGFWGNATSTMNYCEEDYAVSHYVAEFWNTLSNLAFLVFSVYGLYLCKVFGFGTRFSVQFWGCLLIGIGSAVFHGTLKKAAQFTDQIPMVWSIMNWFYLNYSGDFQGSPVVAAAAPIVIVLYTTAYTLWHFYYPHPKIFQYHFGAWTAIAFLRLSRHAYVSPLPIIRRLYYSYAFLLVTGFAFWQIDLRLCKSLTAMGLNWFQGHALWHIFVGASVLVGPGTLMTVRAHEKGLKAHVQWVLGVVPLLEFVKDAKD